MKICAIICEFNPFHNGHGYLIRQAKKLSGCDFVLCIMSGNFTQRGEICIFDKFTKARHAVFSGADAVIELPASFAVAPAEIFAKGAVKILSSIPDVKYLAFGCENQLDFLSLAKKATKESERFKTDLDSALASGEGYAAAYEHAAKSSGIDTAAISSPNNVLALEYAKAILHFRSDIELLPVLRNGGGYLDENLTDGFASSTAIRANIGNRNLKKYLPACVYEDLKSVNGNAERWEAILRYSLERSDARTLSDCFGCTEGLENKLKSFSGLSSYEIIENASGKRYTRTRIRRILTANALNLKASQTNKFLRSKLYLKPLAIKAEIKDELFSSLAQSKYPVTIKKRDCEKLSPTARKCLECDVLSSRIWEMVNEKNIYDFTVLTV